MLILYRVALAVMGASALYVGALNTVLGSAVIAQFYEVQLTDAQAITAVDTQARILAGMWTAAGLFVLYAIKDFARYTVPLAFVFLGFALSAIGEFSTQVMLGNAIDALPKVLVQVVVPVGIAVWGFFVARKQQG
jgi:hypothetical protein